MNTAPQPGPLTDEALSQLMDGLWTRFLPDIRARVSVLEATGLAASEGKLTANEREAARSAAHKLAGVLGTFGLTRGTILARELELTFTREYPQSQRAGAKLAETAAELRSMVESRKPSA
jgi:HPt (histidine-containing phosphotransfer) domain-containing protein